MCVFTSEAGGLDDWAGSLRGLKTDPAGKEEVSPKEEILKQFSSTQLNL